MGGVRRRGLIALTAGALCAAVLAGGGSVAVAIPGRSAAKPPSQASVAKKLATKVVGARKPAARYKALLAVMRSLHVGVYNPKGKAIVRGAERKAKEFAVYDFELRTMAAALARKQEYGAGDLARFLTAIGIKPGGQAVAPDAARGALVFATRLAARSPRKRSVLGLLLARELGRRHAQPYDLANVPTARLKLDPLQYFLVTADLAAPFTRTALGRASAQRGVARSSGVCAALRIAGLGPAAPVLLSEWMLDSIGDSELAELGQDVGGEVIKALIGYERRLEQLGAEHAVERLELVEALKDAVHGALLAFSIKAQAITTTRQETHYGPAGHVPKAGTVLRFQVILAMLDNYPEAVVDCLADLGIADFPKKGPIAGVKIVWTDEENELERYGTVGYEPEDQRTNGKGIATLVFTPKDEIVPGFPSGLGKLDSGLIDAYPLYQSKFGNLPGSLAQFITPKFAGAMAWSVGYHKPRGFKFSGLKWHVEAEPDPVYGISTSDFEVVSARVCGGDPSAVWEMHVHEISNWVLPSYQFDGIYDGVWAPGQDFVSSRSLGASGYGDFSIGPPPQVRLRTQVDEGYEDAGVRIVELVKVATVEEDTSCPEVDP